MRCKPFIRYARKIFERYKKLNIKYHHRLKDNPDTAPASLGGFGWVEENRSKEKKIMDETRTYEITGKPKQLDILERVLGRMEALGNMGCSRVIRIFVDGDGAVRLKVRKDGKRLQHEDIEQDGDGFMITDSTGHVRADLG
jgi:hypothetical protein